ncbi:MAG: preprotein translocase subunit SecG [Sterolibacterium sp.]|jgi:preprotein translocase subunit SecG|nr:preprotein translocase subunit SecG [Sterolibacterium sp.]
MQGFLYPLVLTVHLLVGLAVIGLVLLQHGKGADMGAAFGSGSSGSLFGSSGSANFMSRTTAVLAAVFFVTSLSLSSMATSHTKPVSSVLDAVKTQKTPADAAAVPVSPAVPGDAKGQSVPK